MTTHRIIAILAGAVVVGAVTLGATRSQSESYPRQIQVAGTAMVYAKPDQATVTLGVTKLASRVLEAKTECDQTMQRIQSAMVKAGVKPDDIQTVEYTIYPVQAKPGAARQWKVTHQVSVKIRKVSAVASVVDSAAGAGANAISNIQFGIEDVLAQKAKARNEALRIAREKAEQIAGATGVKLGVPISITDQSQEGMPYQFSVNESMASDMSGYVAHAPVAAGQIQVAVQVSVSYAID